MTERTGPERHEEARAREARAIGADGPALILGAALGASPRGLGEAVFIARAYSDDVTLLTLG